MQAYRDSRAEQIEILPLVVVTQAFPTRPSSLPDIRDFVRRRLAPTTLSEEDVRTLCERAAELLLDAAGADGMLQVSLRTFPAYAEVDVLFAELGEGTDHARGIGASPAAAGGSRPAEASPTADGAESVERAEEEVAVERPATVSFADWLADALRRDGMTLEAAARRLGVSAKTVSRWVGGATEPRLRDLSRIREVFGELPFP
jgi:DNA-binding transcriptional regulator YiaG